MNILKETPKPFTLSIKVGKVYVCVIVNGGHITLEGRYDGISYVHSMEHIPTMLELDLFTRGYYG